MVTKNLPAELDPVLDIENWCDLEEYLSDLDRLYCYHGDGFHISFNAPINRGTP